MPEMYSSVLRTDKANRTDPVLPATQSGKVRHTTLQDKSVVPGHYRVLQSTRTQDPIGREHFHSSAHVETVRHANVGHQSALRIDHPKATSRIIITMKPPMNPSVARSVYLSCCVSGITSSTTT